MKKFFSILFLSLLLGSNSLFAQCDPAIIVTNSTATAALCPSNGSITVTASGTGLTYQLINGPAGFSTASNSTGIFNSLVAGSYTVQIRDANGNTCTIVKDVIDSYPDFSVNNAVVSGVCESGVMGGTITATISGGNPNYEYDIVPIGSAPTYGAATASTSYNETVTAFGTYRVYAKDACGEVRTYDIEVLPTQPTPTQVTYEEILLNRPCGETMDGLPTVTWLLHFTDQYGQGIDFSQMIGSTYQLYKASGPIDASTTNGDCTTPLGALLSSGTVTSTNYNGTGFPIVIPQEDVILVFTNKCGQTFKYCYNFFRGGTIFQDAAFNVIQQSCGATWEDQNITVFLKSTFGFTAPIEYVLTKNGGGTETNNSGNFNNLTPADLPATVTVTDVCGRTVTRTINKPVKGSRIEASANGEYNLACTNIKGTASAAITITGGDLAGFAEASVTITGGTATVVPAISSFISFIPGYWVSNLLAGHTYRIDFTNQCGEPDFYEFTVPDDHWNQTTLNWNLTASASALCGQNRSTITASANYTGRRALNYYLYNLTAPNTIIATNNSGVFNNVTPGNYKVKFQVTPDAACPDKLVRDSINVTVIDDATGQSITNKTISTCENNGTPTNAGKATITVNGSGPFTYEIIKTSLIGAGASEVWNASSINNSSNTYTWEIPLIGDPGNTIYTLRSTDNCGNKVTTQASLQPLEVPVVESQNHPCEGANNYTLTIKPYAGNFTYRWVKLPDLATTLSSQNTLTFPGAYTATKDGTYRCFISLDGCLERMKDVKITSANCGIALPVKLVSFSGTYNNSTAQLKWVGENEIDFSHYEIERSINGIDFIKTSEVQGMNNSSFANSYSAVDDLNNFTGNVVYYRLKLVDLDGKFTHSSIIRLNIKGSEMQLLVYPNPAKEAVSLAFNSIANTIAEIRIIDKLGRVIIKKSMKVIKGYNVFRMDETEALPAGFYVVEVKTPGQTQSSKFIKYSK